MKQIYMLFCLLKIENFLRASGIDLVYKQNDAEEVWFASLVLY